MNKKLKTGLRFAFDAPKPASKDNFLKNLTYPKASSLEFFISQIRYIRKRFWLCSTLLFIILVVALNYYTASLDAVWAASSALPFLALATMGEVTRSRFCSMAELEISCKHSLLQVTLVRLLVLGSMNVVVFLALLVSFIGKTDLGFLRLGVYLLMPFLISSYALLLVANHFKSRESLYVGAAITGFISLSSILLSTGYSVLFTEKYLAPWLFAFVSFTIAVIAQMIKLIKKTEELEWSLQLTA